LNSQTTTERLAETILKTTAEKKPETVNQLIELVKQAYPASNKEILDTIIKLQNDGKLHLTEPQQQTLATTAYLRTSAALWFWITIALTLATVAAVFTIPADNDNPLIYIRYVLGAIFVLWLPGYAFMKALFPQRSPVKTSSEDLDPIQRIALSIGMSLALVPMVALLLNYTPWGITLTPIVLTLVALTVVFAVAALMREHHIATEKKP
jgi:uncharacterized membrane protein